MKWSSGFFKVLFVAALLIVWLKIFSPFLENGLVLYADAHRNYIYTNYYLQNLIRGEYAQWNPYLVWGKPDDFPPRMIGDFNPLVTLMGVFLAAGFSFTKIYFVYLMGQVMLLMLGFFLLARQVLTSFAGQALALMLLLFSSIGSNAFNDLLLIPILIQSVWFCFFALRFMKYRLSGDFTGAVFVIMLALVNYLPFYFLGTAVLVLTGCCLFFPVRAWTQTKLLISWCRHRPIITVISFLGLILAATPGLFWFMSSQGGEYVVSWRGFADQAAGLSQQAIHAGGVIGTITLRRLVSGIGGVIHTGFFFVPLAVFIVAGWGIFVRFNRVSVLLFLLSALLLFIGLGGVTPVHPWLYQHVPGFQMIRNIHYFVWLGMLPLCLFLGGVYEGLIKELDQKYFRRIFWPATLLVFNGGLFWVLMNAQAELSTAWWTFAWGVLLGLMLVNQRYRRVFASGVVGASLLALLVVPYGTQALRIMEQRSRNVIPYSLYPHNRNDSTPVFQYVRPAPGGEADQTELMGFGEVRDTSGFVIADEGNYVGLKRTYWVYRNFSQETLAEYVKYKFILYHHIVPIDTYEEEHRRLKDVFGFKEPGALVEGGVLLDPSAAGLLEGNSGPLPVLGPRDDFKVTAFQLNQIRLQTNFTSPTLIVYNDSYHRDWSAAANGIALKVYPANAAFKGVIIPAGEQDVVICFRKGRGLYFMMLIGFFAGFMVWMLVLFCAERRKKRGTPCSDR